MSTRGGVKVTRSFPEGRVSLVLGPFSEVGYTQGGMGYNRVGVGYSQGGYTIPRGYSKCRE